MHILVCVKQVPVSENVQVDPATGCLLRAGVQGRLNPCDVYALEAAVELKEQLGGTVSVLSMGPAGAEAVLREGIARGADRAYLLEDAALAGSDTWATSYALSQGVAKIQAQEKVDFIFCGKQTSDSDSGQVGPQLAAWLHWPLAAFVRRIVQAGADGLTMECQRENRVITCHLPRPCVLTVTQDVSCPRVPGVKGRLAAKRAGITRWTAADIGADRDKLGLAHSPTKVVGCQPVKRDSQAVVVQGATGAEKAARLVALLQENQYI